MSILSKYRKTSLLLLAIIIILGIYIRFNDFNSESYWNDDMTTIPTALMWFYPHSYYPGLAGQGEPALGNYFIGLGCMLSNQDFSKVTQIQPMFYPGRPELIGQEMVKAEKYCHLPMYLFGLLFFMAIIVLAILMLDEYSSIFAIAFYSFSSFILQLSRWVHVDTIEYFFLALGLIFLWKFYVKAADSRYESLLVVLASLSFGFAFASKLPAGIFIIFLALIMLKKYKNEALGVLKTMLKGLNLKASEKITGNENPGRILKLAAYSILSYAAAILLSFEFKFKNLLLVAEKYSSVNPEHSFISLNKQVLLDIYNFIITLNAIDTLLLVFSLYIVIRLIFSKRDKNEEFLLYLFALFAITLLFFTALNYTRVFYIFSPAIIFIMAMAFSEKEYSLFSALKVSRKNIFFIIFMVIYIVFSFTTVLASSPHFTPKNQLVCIFNGPECSPEKLKYFTNPYGLSAKYIASDLSNILEENETFLSSSEMVYYYIRQEDSYELYSFISSARKQLNRRPTMNEFLAYFKPKGRTLRYVVVNPHSVDADFPEFESLKKDYAPNHIVKAYKMDVAYIYDAKNLKPKA